MCQQKESQFSLWFIYPSDLVPVKGFASKNMWTTEIGLDGLKTKRNKRMGKGNKVGWI